MTVKLLSSSRYSQQNRNLQKEGKEHEEGEEE